MSNTTPQIIISHTTTERRHYLRTVTPDEHKQLTAEGFRYDGLAGQYRRSKTDRHQVDANGNVTKIEA